jgi:hypothetical protein
LIRVSRFDCDIRSINRRRINPERIGKNRVLHLAPGGGKGTAELTVLVLP